jgi:uncharacterized membrane protein
MQQNLPDEPKDDIVPTQDIDDRDEDRLHSVTRVPDTSPAITTAIKFYQGPIPPPEQLKAYNDVMPGAAMRIFDMAEKQQNHRIEMENKIVSGGERRSLLGLCFGFAIACGSFLGGYDLIRRGHDVAGAVLGGSAGLGSLVSIFVYNDRSRRNRDSQNREDRQNARQEE